MNKCCCQREIIKIQVAFSHKADLGVVKEGFDRIRKEFGKGNFKLFSLQMPRHIVEERKLTTDIVDLLDSVPEHEYSLESAKDFGEFMGKIDEARELLADATDKLIVLDSGVAQGIQKEVMAHSKKILMW